MADEFDLAALIASRICHDLISPIGAIGNGVELLAMAGLESSPELGLIDESVKNAQGRIRFFRLAFGRAEDGQQVSAAELRSTLSEYLDGGRVRLDWPVEAAVSRAEARAVFLAINCLEVELAYGGEIAVSDGADGWEVVARASRLRGDEAAWAALESGARAGLAPAQLQFALLPMAVSASGRRLTVARGEAEIALRF